MKVDTYNQEGKKVGQTELPKEIFEVQINPDLVHQVAVAQMANRRQGSAHTKDRSAVAGGGKKPWRQKHTGRARHGSIRSPIWKGGGVTFGPTNEKVYTKKVNAKMRRKALCMVLSEMAKNKLILLMDELKLGKAKTKSLTEILNVLPCKEKTSLIMLSDMNKNVILAARNLPKTDTIQAKDLNVLDVMNKKYIVMPQDTISVVKQTFFDKGKKEAVEKKPVKKKVMTAKKKTATKKKVIKKD